MTARLVLAVAADREVRVLRHCREQSDQAIGGRRLHLAAVRLRNPLPVLQRSRDELLARREIGLAQNLGGSGASCVVTILAAA